MSIPATIIGFVIAAALVTTIPIGGSSRAQEYAVASANAAATEAGMAVLARGGSAADAAVAIQMILGVVEPQSSGLGGGAIALYRSADGRDFVAFDGLSKSPATYDGSQEAAKGFSHSGASVGVPGTLRMLEAMHHRFGRLPWNALFQKAIDIASSGFESPPYLASTLSISIRAGMVAPPWLLDGNGKPVVSGTKVQNLALAALMRDISAKGADALYVGAGSDIVNAVQRGPLRGTLTSDDISGYRPVERKPVCMSTANGTMCAAPPPSYGGVAAMELIGIIHLLPAPYGEFGSLLDVHHFIEAGRIVEADQLATSGDPDKGAASIDGLLRLAYLRSRAGLIGDHSSLLDPITGGLAKGREAGCGVAKHPPQPSTSQFVVVDQYGNVLSMTTTNNVDFGAWVTVDGFFLNDAMTNFAFPADSPCSNNAPGGGKRPATAMGPIMEMDRAGHVRIAGGSAGSGAIVDYIAQDLLALEAGSDPSAALDIGHVSTARASYGETPGLVELEAGRATAQFANGLRSLGHLDIKVVPLLSGAAFIERRQGHWTGASDPRRDGTFATSAHSVQ